MADVAKTSPHHLENLANVIHKQMLMGKVLAVLRWDGVEIVQITVIAQLVLITLQVMCKLSVGVRVVSTPYNSLFPCQKSRVSFR